MSLYKLIYIYNLFIMNQYYLVSSDIVEDYDIDKYS